MQRSRRSKWQSELQKKNAALEQAQADLRKTNAELQEAQAELVVENKALKAQVSVHK